MSRRDDRVFGVFQDALERPGGGLLERRVDVGRPSLPVFTSTVRSVMLPSGTGTRRAKPSSLPLSCGSTSPMALAAPVEDGDDVRGGGPGPAQVVVDLVGDALVVGVGVNRRHHALHDAEILVEQHGHRRQAIGRAAGVGDALGPRRFSLLVVDAQDDGHGPGPWQGQR